MNRIVLVCLTVFSFSACEDHCPPDAPCTAAGAPTTQGGEIVTPVALDPNRPQPPAPTAQDVSRSMERAPRGPN